jgi:hypothetical protein
MSQDKVCHQTAVKQVNRGMETWNIDHEILAPITSCERGAKPDTPKILAEMRLQREKETKRIQEGIEIDGILAKGRIQIRGCAGFCGHYVQPTDKYCPNCGIIEPYTERPYASLTDFYDIDKGFLSTLSEEKMRERFLFAPTIFLIITPIIFRIKFGIWNIQLSFLISIVAYISYIIREYFETKIKKKRNYNSIINKINSHEKTTHPCLNNTYDSINERLIQNVAEERKLEKIIRSNESLENTKRGHLAISTMKETLQVRRAKRLQCETILWEIGKARVVNKGVVVLWDKSSGSVTRREQYSQLLKEHIEKGYILVRTWQHDNDRRIQDILTRLQESLRVCEEVRGGLLAQQAKILATGVTNFDNSLLKCAQIDTEEAELFHTLGAATDTLFSGFGELEQEYYRLLGEKEVIQDLGTVQ